jgi:hydroxymethylpyrimidine pyrophosphatase-like HAD family hydrolase
MKPGWKGAAMKLSVKNQNNVNENQRPLKPKQGRFLLAADIDGTLLGDEVGEARLKEFAAQRDGLFTLAYITGRYRWSVLNLVEQGHLPRPDFICSDVGTEILDLNDPANRLGQQYANLVPPSWDLDEIYRLGLGDGIRRQEFDEGQPQFQAGFYWDARPESLSAFKERLSGLDQVYIQASYDTYIDVLPMALGKGQAVSFLQKQLGILPGRVMVAGDSGNDRQMFETSFKGVVPINALDELKKSARQPWHYHSPYPAARGVLDGLRHFGFIESSDGLEDESV